MIRGTLVPLALLSVVLFPWPFAAALALGTSFLEPLVPLSVGLLADALYFTPHANALPVCTLCGAAASALVLFVRRQLKTSSIGG